MPRKNRRPQPPPSTRRPIDHDDLEAIARAFGYHSAADMDAKGRQAVKARAKNGTAS
ncbi:hypothetical protein [Nocardia niigatensis]